MNKKTILILCLYLLMAGYVIKTALQSNVEEARETETTELTEFQLMESLSEEARDWFIAYETTVIEQDAKGREKLIERLNSLTEKDLRLLEAILRKQGGVR